MTQTLEDLYARLQPVIRPGETPNTLLETVVNGIIAERAQESAHWEAARADAQAVLNGPFRSHAESATDVYRRLGLTPPSQRPHETSEERATKADAFLDALPSEKIAELERL